MQPDENMRHTICARPTRLVMLTASECLSRTCSRLLARARVRHLEDGRGRWPGLSFTPLKTPCDRQTRGTSGKLPTTGTPSCVFNADLKALPVPRRRISIGGDVMGPFIPLLTRRRDELGDQQQDGRLLASTHRHRLVTGDGRDVKVESRGDFQ